MTTTISATADATAREQQLTDRLREIEKLKSRPIIVNGQAGAHAAKVCGALKKIGFTDVVALRGGLNGQHKAPWPALRSALDEAVRVHLRSDVPLGVCLLPAFVLIGVVPLVAGSLTVLLGH